MTSALRDSGLDFVNGSVPDPRQDGWYVFSRVRNEKLSLPYFLHYYRKMGAKLFIIVDNQSQDGTTRYLTDQPDVLLFHASGSYSESRSGVEWLNVLLHRYGQDRWCLTVDVDELLVFPHCEQLSLIELTRYLDAKGANTLPAFLLDMYAQEPIREARYQSGTSFLSSCPFFDAKGYKKQGRSGPTRNMPTRGGARHRLFWKGYIRVRPSPYLPKIPLVRWSKDMRYETSTHVLSNSLISDVSGALLHFKLFADFRSRVEEEVRRREYFNGASQYATYRKVISRQPDLCAFYEGSACYRDSRQLMEMGLIHSSESFDLLTSSSGESSG